MGEAKMSGNAWGVSRSALRIFSLFVGTAGWFSSSAGAGSMVNLPYRSEGYVNRDQQDGTIAPITLDGVSGPITGNSTINLATFRVVPSAGSPQRQVSVNFAVDLSLLGGESVASSPPFPPLLARGVVTGTIGGSETSLHIHFEPASTPFGGYYTNIFGISATGVVAVGDVPGDHPSHTSLIGLLRLDRADYDLSGPSSEPLTLQVTSHFEVHAVPEPSGLMFGGLALFLTAITRRRAIFQA